MRIFAGIMVFVVAVVGIFFGYCYYGAQNVIFGDGGIAFS